MAERIDQLGWNVPITDAKGRPTDEFQRKWRQLAAAAGLIPAVGTSTEVSSILDKIGSSSGSLLVRKSAYWEPLASPSDATKFLSGAAIPAWAQVKDTDLSLTDVTGNNASTGQHGFLRKLSGTATQFLDGAGNFDTVKDSDLATTDITTNNADASKHGFLPKLSGTATEFLNGVGAWATPAGGGGGGGGSVSAMAAYVEFVPGSPPTISDSVNIASVTRTGTGRYRITFSAAMSDAYYQIAFAARHTDSGSTDLVPNIGIDRRTGYGKTTTYLDVTINAGGTATPSDSETIVDVAFFDTGASGYPLAASPHNSTLLILGSDHTTTSSTWATISNWSQVRDTLGAFDAGTPSRITVPAGVSLCRLTFKLAWGNTSSGNRYVYMYHFDSGGGFVDSPLGDIRQAANETTMSLISPWIDVAEGDYFYINVNPGATTASVESNGFGSPTWWQAEWA